ncbi:hypothetical protein AnigIFM50267_001661 [Aspergillus niger]|nr:hypothetical protein AnigIFM50267_001661 [Aspergillus niger]
MTGPFVTPPPSDLFNVSPRTADHLPCLLESLTAHSPVFAERVIEIPAHILIYTGILHVSKGHGGGWRVGRLSINTFLSPAIQGHAFSEERIRADPTHYASSARVNTISENTVLERTALCVSGQISAVGLRQDRSRLSAKSGDLKKIVIGLLDFSPQRGRGQDRYIPYPSATKKVPLAIDQNCQLRHIKINIQALLSEILDASFEKADPILPSARRIIGFFLGKLVTELDDTQHDLKP